MRVHELKTWPDDFRSIVNGTKTHEARRNDRGFAVDDVLRLNEWRPASMDACSWETTGLTGTYTGNCVHVRVTHLTIGQYGLPDDLAIMSVCRTSGPS